MKPHSPEILMHSSCVNPADLAGFTQLLCKPMGYERCGKPTYSAGFTQLAVAGQVVTKRVFTQLGLYRGR